MSATAVSAEPVEPRTTRSGRRSEAERSRHWWIALGVIVALGLGLRLLHLSQTKWGTVPAGDAYYYHVQANFIADGRGFIDPFSIKYHQGVRQVATHPPLFSLVLAAISWLGARSADAHRVACCFMGAGTVLLVGILGRKLGGRRAGLIAAACAAFYPNLWGPDNQGLSESLFGLLIAGTLLSAYSFWRRPNVWRAAGFGALCMLCALTRGEAILLFPLLLVPLVFMIRRVGTRRALGLGAVALIVGAVVLAPWTIYNLGRFENPVLISTNDGQTFMYANCDITYEPSNVLFAYWSLSGCYGSYQANPDESVADVDMRAIAWKYVSHHKRELPTVLPGRFAREWQLWAPIQGFKLERVEGRAKSLSWMALISFYVLGIFAIVGAVLLRKRRTYPVWPLVSMFVLVSITAVVFYATFRFRIPAEVALVVLAALGIDGLLRRRWPVDDDPPPVLEPRTPAKLG
ncbi:MAG: hypothetical protein JWL73_2689 [Actinomycetia bacterium]|nr:hypothetical protein [Actinomycetes bacterium]